MDSTNFDQFLDSWMDKEMDYASPSDVMSDLFSVDENDSKYLISDQPIVLVKENGVKITLTRPSK